MLREAELFTTAEKMLVEVLGRIRDQDLAIELPPMSDLPAGGDALGQIVARYACDDACVPGILTGATADAIDAGAVEREVSADRKAAVARIAAAAGAAARDVADGDTVVHSRYGDVSARDYLLRLSVNRSLIAHYVAAYLGSTACPLPEELARPLWELTAPNAQVWRERGIFGEPTPIPDKASWRDTFLRTGGHEPHPLGH